MRRVRTCVSALALAALAALACACTTQPGQQQANQQGTPQQALPGAMGTREVPDMGAQAIAPQQQGVAPVRTNGAVQGAGPGAVVPQQAGAALMQ